MMPSRQSMDIVGVFCCSLALSGWNFSLHAWEARVLIKSGRNEKESHTVKGNRGEVVWLGALAQNTHHGLRLIIIVTWYTDPNLCMYAIKSGGSSFFHQVQPDWIIQEQERWGACGSEVTPHVQVGRELVVQTQPSWLCHHQDQSIIRRDGGVWYA